MSIVLEEWELTTNVAEEEIWNRSMLDLDVEYPNLHHERM